MTARTVLAALALVAMGGCAASATPSGPASPPRTVVESVASAASTPTTTTVDRGVAHPSGLLTQLRLPGLDPRLNPAQVWLPPQYFDAARRTDRFPVLLAMAPMHGTGAVLLRKVDLPALALTTMKAGRTKPFILVALPSRSRFDWDSECMDLPGDASQTFFSHEVVQAVASAYATVAPGKGWYTTGFSTGGQCAALLQARHPEVFTASVSVGGYFTPEPEEKSVAQTTPQLVDDNSVLRMVERRTIRRLDLLDVASSNDSSTWGVRHHAPGKPDGADFHAAAKGFPGVEFRVFPGGGHSFPTYARQWQPSLEWLGTRGL